MRSAGIMLSLIACMLLFDQARARAEIGEGEVEEIYVARSVRVSRVVPSDYCTPTKTGFAMALLPFVTLPSGRKDVGAGDWGAGTIITTSYKLNDTLSLEMTPEIDAAVNESGSGRHLAWS